MKLQAVKNLSKRTIASFGIVAMMCLMLGLTAPSAASAGTTCGGGLDDNNNAYQTVKTAIDIGCKGKGNPITDAAFGIIRFLTTGVGVILVGSMIYAGIQYSSSRGDPQATAAAVTRIRANVIALLLFLFAYTLLNYIIPGAFLT
jgi:hypothetical protein